jgi:hypothetical protein
MQKYFSVLATLGLIAFAAPMALADDARPSTGDHAQPLMGGEHMAKIREEVRLHEQRAHELEPIIARDHQARHDVEMDWIVLERHARDLHGRANDFRAYAGEVSGRAQNDMNTFAAELDQFAAHDEENAHWQHEMGDRLEHAIQSENLMRDWHLKLAQRLRDWLAANGG